MSESISLEPRTNGKIGVSHCDVTRDGAITVVGDQRDIADGEEITFASSGIKAIRKGSVYTFSRG
jgi:hypothetical protein